MEFFIDGVPMQAEDGQTVIQAARANGVDIPHFCWHPELSVPGNCRICMVEVEQEKGDPWFDIACNMPVTEGMRVLLHSEKIVRLRKQTMQFITLNHPVDCGICNKSGECTLQDFHYAHNGQASLSRDAKTHATKFFPLSDRIMLDNERCIMCTLCVRFTNEVSQSKALCAVNRGDHALIRPAEDANFDNDQYSDNVIDLCPVGALLSRQLLDHARVWYLQPTRSVCPGCERGCSIDIWHRKPEWALRALDPRLNTRIDRVTPHENPEVNGLWVCNKARDLAALFERPRATQATLGGAATDLATATASAARLIAAARHPVALVSSWGSNEELAAFATALAPHVQPFVKADHLPLPGEVVEDHLLIKPDKNPNRRAALALFPALPGTLAEAITPQTDLVLVWGEGFDGSAVPAGARVIRLDAYADPVQAQADVFIPVSIQTERSGHYTNFAGVVSPFTACFAPAAGIAHAEELFRAIGLALAPAVAGALTGPAA
ncbi:MAG: (2Fe-2S)-binding protein [Gemmatimonadaceae bacterium]|nr:(2Fe-2S)-binding protein [Gemmatimonadaceae bacterium]